MMAWQQKKARVYELIKQISEEHGGDEQSFLDEYVHDVVKKYAGNLEVAIACFESVLMKTGKEAENDKDKSETETENPNRAVLESIQFPLESR
jgi:hypothetical protein